MLTVKPSNHYLGGFFNKLGQSSPVSSFDQIDQRNQLWERWKEFAKKGKGGISAWIEFVNTLSRDEKRDIATEVLNRVPQKQKQKMLQYLGIGGSPLISPASVEPSVADPQPVGRQAPAATAPTSMEPATFTSPADDEVNLNQTVTTPEATSGSTTTPANLAQLVRSLKQTTDKFNQTFKGQHQIAEPAMRQIYETLRQLSQKNPNLPLAPQALQSVQSLINTIAQAANEEMQDAQAMRQIGQQAQQTAQLLGLDPTKQQQFMRGQKQPAATQPAAGTAPATAVTPPGTPAPVAPAKGKNWGGGIAQGVGNMLGNLTSIPGNIGRGLQQGWRGGRQPVPASTFPLFVKSAHQMIK